MLSVSMSLNTSQFICDDLTALDFDAFSTGKVTEANKVGLLRESISQVPTHNTKLSQYTNRTPNLFIKTFSKGDFII